MFKVFTNVKTHPLFVSSFPYAANRDSYENWAQINLPDLRKTFTTLIITLDTSIIKKLQLLSKTILKPIKTVKTV